MKLGAILPTIFGLALQPVLAWLPQPVEELRNVKTGDPLPAFTAQGLDGKPCDSAAFKGRVFILAFVRPNQKPSENTLEIIQRVLDACPEPKPAALAVFSNHDAADYAKRVVAEKRLTFPVALDAERKMYGDFGLIVTPTTLLVDETGILRFEMPHVPPEFERRLKLHLDLLMKRINAQQHEEALKQTEQSPSGWNDAYRSQLTLAQTLIDRKSFEEALKMLLQLKAEKETPQVMILLGRTCLALNRVEEAARYLDPLKDAGPLAPTALFALGQLEARRGNEDQAEAYLAEALKGYPQKAPVLFELGRLHERKGRCDKAAECYRKALEELFPVP
ncbi:MAG: tetratricopeptide repeat protein [Phycisphaerales bacterium]|nr:tetratricopeptide repeat protein [Phycisphaerales bacterium]